MTRDEAKTFLEQHLEPVCTYLFPAAKRDGAHFVVGNIEGAPGESFRVCLQGANRGLYKDFASGEKASRDLIGLWMKARCVPFKTALSEIAAFAGVAHSNGKEPPVERIRPTFDWSACVRALTEERLAEIAEWRGYTIEFCRTLAADRQIGLYQDRIAFPVHDQAGNVVGPHYYVAEKHDWFYTKGTRVRPLVYGDLYNAGEVHAFESQWDALGVMERCGLYKESGVAFLITRGSSNGGLIRGRLPDSADVLAWPQNDKPNEEDGSIPSEKWLEDVISAAGRRVRVVRTPEEYEDANAWTRAGASAEEIGRAVIEAEPREKPEVTPESDGGKEISRQRGNAVPPDSESDSRPQLILPNNHGTEVSQCARQLFPILSKRARYFAKGRLIVERVPDKKGGFVLQPVQSAAFRSGLEKSFRLFVVRMLEKEKVLKPTLCTKDNADVLLASGPPQYQGGNHFLEEGQNVTPGK
jgi:hypothetical protein